MSTVYIPHHAGSYLRGGSTATVWKHSNRSGTVIRAPIECWWESDTADELSNKFSVEAQILERLGEHKNIVRYLGPLDSSTPVRSLLFEEAPNGDLQHYLQDEQNSIDDTQRLRWCEDVARGLSYCHKMGVIHCDLRPDNLLIDSSLNIRICDFGGSKYKELYGGDLPDFGFFDPRDDTTIVTENTEVFSLGSIMYSIMTGKRPHGPSVFQSSSDIISYGAEFERHLFKGVLPDTTGIIIGGVIQDCWTKRIVSAAQALACLQHIRMQAGINGTLSTSKDTTTRDI